LKHSRSTISHAAASFPKQEKGRCLTSFSPGTEFAGIFGFFWKWFGNDGLIYTLSTTLWLAMGLAVGYWATFQFVVKQEAKSRQWKHSKLS
jgi:hypothetical protein